MLSQILLQKCFFYYLFSKKNECYEILVHILLLHNQNLALHTIQNLNVIRKTIRTVMVETYLALSSSKCSPIL